MNLVEKKVCLLCRQAIVRTEEVLVLANVLFAHAGCAGEGSR